MMRLLIELWPALLPIGLYLLWALRRRRKACKSGEECPPLSDGPWLWALVASIGIALLIVVLAGVSAPSVKGEYVPPRVENGKLTPGHIERTP